MIPDEVALNLHSLAPTARLCWRLHYKYTVTSVTIPLYDLNFNKFLLSIRGGECSSMLCIVHNHFLERTNLSACNFTQLDQGRSQVLVTKYVQCEIMRLSESSTPYM